MDGVDRRRVGVAGLGLLRLSFSHRLLPRRCDPKYFQISPWLFLLYPSIWWMTSGRQRRLKRWLVVIRLPAPAGWLVPIILSIVTFNITVACRDDSSRKCMEGLESYHQTVSYVCTDRLQPPRHEACEVCSLAADRSPGSSSRVDQWPWASPGWYFSDICLKSRQSHPYHTDSGRLTGGGWSRLPLHGGKKVSPQATNAKLFLGLFAAHAKHLVIPDEW